MKLRALDVLDHRLHADRLSVTVENGQLAIDLAQKIHDSRNNTPPVCPTTAAHPAQRLQCLAAGRIASRCARGFSPEPTDGAASGAAASWAADGIYPNLHVTLMALSPQAAAPAGYASDRSGAARRTCKIVFSP